MEGAARVFAGEFSESTLYVPSEDAGSSGWVVTSGGAYCRQMFLAGVLTEITEKGDMLHCRVADPTGAFDIVTGGKNTALARAFQNIPIPSFVAVSGCARMYQKNNHCVLSIRPEQVMAIDRACRDQIFLTTAEYSLHRLDQLRLAVLGNYTDEPFKSTLSHYAVSPMTIRNLVQMIEGALQGIRPKESTPPAGQQEVRSAVMDILEGVKGPRGVAVEEIINMLTSRGIRKEEVLAALELLIVEDECYQPQKGFVKLL